MSITLSLTSVLAIVFGLKRIPIAEFGFVWTQAICIAAGCALGWLFLRRQSRLPAPMIDLGLLRKPLFAAALATLGISCFVSYGAQLLVALYLQLVLGLGPLAAGLCTLPFSAVLIVGGTLTPFIARRMEPASILVVGLIVAAVGLAMLSTVDRATTPAHLAGIYCMFALGLAPVFSVGINLIVGCTPPERAGTASAISETASEFGGALGIALLGSALTALYRIALAQKVHLERFEFGAVDTLTSAVAVAHRIGGAFGTTLLDASHSAFVQAFRVTTILSALILAINAILVNRRLSARKPDSIKE